MVLSLNKANDPLRKYKEVFISLGGMLSKVYRVEVSPEEYLTYTTEEKEKISVQAAAKKYGSMERGIKSLVFGCCLLLAISGFGQVPVLGPIIKAIDLKVQQLQNETLVLQNLQKQIENKLHAMKLAEISEWSQKQKFLFKEYYAELGQVRPALDSLFTRKKY
jgi:hypothetical protein